MRNTEIENSLDRKMKPRYFGPMIVIRRAKGGSYLLAEMDGSLYHKKVAQFRVVPYYARKEIPLPKDITKLTGLSERSLHELENSLEPEDEKEIGRDYSFDGVRLKENGQDETEDGDSDPEDLVEDGSDGSDSEDEESIAPPKRKLRKRK